MNRTTESTKRSRSAAERPGARSHIRHAARTLGTLTLLTLGGVLLLRCSARRPPVEAGLCQAAPRRTGRASYRCDDIAQDVSNRLGAIRGYCELAKMKGENGDALARRMDAAVETVTEVSALLRQLLAACRRQEP